MWSQDCTSGDCIEGYGNYIYEDGSKYMGMFKEGKNLVKVYLFSLMVQNILVFIKMIRCMV